MARGAPGHGGEWQAARAPGARGRRRRRPSRAAPVGGALATRECGAAEPGGRAGEPAGARAGARLRTRVAVGRAARSSRGRRACCWHPARQAWAAFASGRGSPVPGRPGSPGLPPPPGHRDPAAAQARRRQRRPSVRSPRARPGRGIGARTRVGAGGVRGAAARTPSSKLPGRRPRGRPGPPRAASARAGCTARAGAGPAAAAAGALRFAM